MAKSLRRIAIMACVVASAYWSEQVSTLTVAQTKDKVGTKKGNATASPAQAAHLRLQENFHKYIADRVAGIAYRPKIATPPPPLDLELARRSTVPFKDPPALHSKDGELAITLTVTKAKNRIGEDVVFLRNYNGELVGPTLRARPGDTLRIVLKNQLDANAATDVDAINTMHRFNTTNLHTHGLHVSPAGDSDNVLREVAPGQTAAYSITIPATHPAGTFWYHSHHHGSVAAQVGSGMAGALIIEGGMDRVPEVAAAADRILVLQQIPYYIPPGQAEGVIEDTYSDQCFSPNSWKDLQRFTTINGLKLPVFRMAPSAVERWRLIDTGIHETIHFKLIKVNPNGKLGETLPLHAIAFDGLALGDLEVQKHIELWPGYRADVLVKAPDAPAEYVLVDERADGTQTMAGAVKERNFIGRLVVAGKPDPMALPAAKSLEEFRLPSIQPKELTGTQSATYSLVHVNDPAKPYQFLIDGKPFDPGAPRVLTLGKVEEWTVATRNKVEGGPWTHPFHIHVNPFEVVSMKDEKNMERLTRPVWRDTLAIPDGWTFKLRTRYQDFTGDFVQHCHILAHEDWGMMELIRIARPGQAGLGGKVPDAAVSWKLPDAAGKVRTWSEYSGRPAVLVFSKGYGCLHCAQQIRVFSEKADQFKKRGVEVVFISNDSVKSLAAAQSEAPPLPFALLADPDCMTFRSYGCYGDEPLHGAFLIDRNGKIQWHSIATSPLMTVDPLLRALEKKTGR